MLVEWTYHSNAIEGNTLTLSETKVVLEGIMVGGKTMHEHLEVINHKDVILFLEDLINRKESFGEYNHQWSKRLRNTIMTGKSSIQSTELPIFMVSLSRYILLLTETDELQGCYSILN